jgi:hypothetical protein
MFITQSPEAIKQSLELNAHAAIDAIRLASATLWSVPPERFGPEMSAESEVSFRPGVFRKGDHSLIFGIDFKCTARTTEEGAKPQDLIKISCVLEAEYSVNPEFEPRDDQIKAFHAGNAIFNSWPYFREFVQNSVVRMHLPPPPVPFLRLMPPKMGDAKRKRALREPKALKEGASEL